MTIRGSWKSNGWRASGKNIPLRSTNRYLKSCFDHFLDHLWLPKRVIVQYRHAGLLQLAALADQPFGPDVFDFRVVLAFQDSIGQIGRQVHMEDLWQHGQLFLVGDGLETRDDRDVDALFTA